MADILAASLGGAESPPSPPRKLEGEIAGVVLAAGEGRRLAPLTRFRPKPLCPVGGVTLLDRAVSAVAAAAAQVAVNVHFGREQMCEALEAHPGVHVSVEDSQALGTAGAIGNLTQWIDGRPVLVVNADTVHSADLVGFVNDWDGKSIRLLTPTAGPFGPRSAVVASLLPAASVAGLSASPSGLWEVLWRDAVASGNLETVHHLGEVLDCGTPAQYLRANMATARVESLIGEGAVVAGEVEQSVVGAGAQVLGSVTRSVVWPGSVVESGEHLVDAIRADRLTILIR